MEEDNIKYQDIISIVLMITLTIIPIYSAGFDNWSIYGFFCFLSITTIYLLIKSKIKISLSLQSPLFWILLFLIWGDLSFIWSVSKVRTIIECIQLLTYILVFVLMIYTEEETREKVGKVTLLIGTLIGFYGILQFLIIDSQRIVGTFPNPNPFGIYLVMLFCISWSVGLRKKNKLISISSTILLVSLFLTGSRGSILCLILSSWILFLALDRKEVVSSIKRSLLLILSSLSITYIIMYIAPFVQKLSLNSGIFKYLIRTESIGSSTMGRLSFWRVAYNLFISKPINGYGLGTFYTAYDSKYEYNGWVSRFAHNTYLQILSEQGIIGIFLFLLFLVTCFFIIFRLIRNKNNTIWIYGAIAAALAFLLHIGMDFSFNFPGCTIIFFAIMGALISLEYKNLKNRFNLNSKIINLVLLIMIAITIIQFSSEYIGEKGIKLSYDQKYNESNKVFELVSKISPMNDQIYFLEALNNVYLYNETKDIKKLEIAENLLAKAIKYGPYKFNYYNQLGVINLKNNEIEKAIKQFGKSTSYSTYRVDPYINLGLAYYMHGDIDKSKETFIKGLEQKDFAYDGLDENQRENVANILAQMNLNLTVIYADEGNEEMKEKYLVEVNKIAKVHSGIKLYDIKTINTTK